MSGDRSTVEAGPLAPMYRLGQGRGERRGETNMAADATTFQTEPALPRRRRQRGRLFTGTETATVL